MDRSGVCPKWSPSDGISDEPFALESFRGLSTSRSLFFLGDGL